MAIKSIRALSDVRSVVGRSFSSLTTTGSAVALVSTVLLVNCAPSAVNQRLSAPEEVHFSQMDINRYPITKTVCDPFEGQPDPRSNAGLKAELFYLNPGQATATSVADLVQRGRKSDRTLFFSQLQVPTRAFSEGFSDDTGDAIKNDNGDKLIENFALRFQTVVKLTPSQEEGDYEFALLSDDGSLLQLRDEDGVWRTDIANDGSHETRFACGEKTHRFDRETEKLMKIDYYQGPRHHIALMVLMRKVSAGTQPDLACGIAGNNQWFDSSNGSTPTARYDDLIGRGWRPLAKQNYSLPVSASFNPCKEGIIPKITNLQISETMPDGFYLTWQTDIPAASQILATDIATGEKTLSESDNVLRTFHAVFIRGLKPSTEYGLQAISISDSYGKGMSTAIYDQTSSN